MESTRRSRRHRNPQAQEAQQTEKQQPFFSKTTAGSTIQTKPETAFFQPKLTIGQANDQYEKEADAVADKVVNPPAPKGSFNAVQKQEISSVQRLATPDEKKMPATNDARMAEDKRIQEKPLQREPKKEEEKPVQKAGMEEEEPLQAKTDNKEEEKPVQKAGMEEEEPLQAKTDNKEEEKPLQKAGMEEEEPLQAKADNKEEEKPVQKAGMEEEEPLQAKAKGGGGVASNAVASKIGQTKGGGNPLPKGTKRKMESAFGRDFRDVHIHTDTSSVEMNKELQAHAFTHGKDIYFNSGKFNPENTEGARLLAHELTHVVQQNEMIQKAGHNGQVQRKKAPLSGMTPKETIDYRIEKKVDEAIGQSPTISPYITKKLKAGLKVEGKVIYHSSQKDMEESRVGTGNKDKEDENVGGYFDRKTGKIHLPPSARLEPLIHESIHKFSNNFRGASSFVNEGFTQLFTNVILSENGLSKGSSYPKQLKVAEAVSSKIGLSRLAEIFFSGSVSDLANELKNKVTKFDWVAFLQMGIDEKVDELVKYLK